MGMLKKGGCHAERSEASSLSHEHRQMPILRFPENNRSRGFFRVPLSLALFVSACLMGARGQTAPAGSLDLSHLSQQAMEAQRRGDYRGAAAIYKQILQRQPGSPEIRSNLGLMYHYLGEYQKAAAAFELALHDNPQLYVPNLFLGLDLLTLQAAQKALPYLQRACDLNQHDSQAQVGLGAAYLALGNHERSRDAYERAVVVDFKDPEAWYGLGVVYLDLQKAAVDRMAERGRESPYAHDLVAHSLVAKGTPDAAVNVYRHLLASKAALPCLEADLGFAYIQTQDFKSAEEAFRNGLKDDPGCLLARLGLARLDLEKGKGDEALGELLAIWTSDQNFVEENLPALFVGMSEGEVGLLEDSCARASGSQQQMLVARFIISAIQALQDETYERRGAPVLVSPEPNGKTATSTGAPADQKPELLLAQGHYTECDHNLWPRRSKLTSTDLRVLCECAYYSGDLRTAFLASGDLAKNSADIVPGLYWRAKSSEELGQAALRQAGLLAPNSPHIHFLLGELYRQRYQEDQAEAEYLMVIELQPNDVAAHLGLADAYRMSADFTKARAELERVLALDPGQPEANYLMGEILVNQDQYAEAMPYLKSVLKGDSLRVLEVHALVGRVYAAQGRTMDAISEFQQARGADRDGSIHLQLSMLYRKAGDTKAAAAALEQSRLIFQQRQGHAAEGANTGPVDYPPKPTSP